MNGFMNDNVVRKALKGLFISLFVFMPLLSQAETDENGTYGTFSMSYFSDDNAEKDGQIASSSFDWSGTHEFNANVGFPMLKTLYTTQMPLVMVLTEIYESVSGTEYDYKGITACPSVGLEYGYNLKKWLNLGAGVYYTNATIPSIYSETGKLAGSITQHFVQVMANVKFYWYNSEWVRLYSSVGAGFYISDLTDTREKQERRTEINFICDMRPLCITVGKKFYGNFQFGALTTGFVTAGIGYRF